MGLLRHVSSRGASTVRWLLERFLEQRKNRLRISVDLVQCGLLRLFPWFIRIDAEMVLGGDKNRLLITFRNQGREMTLRLFSF